MLLKTEAKAKKKKKKVVGSEKNDTLHIKENNLNIN